MNCAAIGRGKRNEATLSAFLNVMLSPPVEIGRGDTRPDDLACYSKPCTFREGIRAPDCADPLPGAPQLPYLRGLAVAPDGTVYAAANGCRTVLRIRAQGSIETVLRAEPPWSPTGVAVSGRDIYVLEYLHTGEDRKVWAPRVKKVAPEGVISTLATIQRQ